LNKKIVVLGGDGISTRIVFNALNDNFGITAAIIEKKISRKTFLKRRIKRLGLTKVFGQILFQAFIAKPLAVLSKRRINEIVIQNALNTDEIPKTRLIAVNSVNDRETIALLKDINPDLIIVNGTRILSKELIASVNCRLINTHAGITPKYRGVHGAYWALVNQDKDHCGVTVHYVDEGIDTGNIIYQGIISPSTKDNFTTYPLLQIAEGVNLLNKAVRDYFDGAIRIQASSGQSRLWYHPAIWEYLYYRITRKVK